MNIYLYLFICLCPLWSTFWKEFCWLSPTTKSRRSNTTVCWFTSMWCRLTMVCHEFPWFSSWKIRNLGVALWSGPIGWYREVGTHHEDHPFWDAVLSAFETRAASREGCPMAAVEGKYRNISENPIPGWRVGPHRNFQVFRPVEASTQVPMDEYHSLTLIKHCIWSIFLPAMSGYQRGYPSIPVFSITHHIPLLWTIQNGGSFHLNEIICLHIYIYIWYTCIHFAIDIVMYICMYVVIYSYIALWNRTVSGK